MKTLILFAVLVLGLPAPLSAQGPTMCTMQYQPVCGTEGGVYKTYGNGCVLGAEGAVYQHEGECSAAELKGEQEGEYMPPAHCTAWFDGCNSCSRSAGGQSMCTLMACMGTPRAGYCRAYAETEVVVSPAPTPLPEEEAAVSIEVAAENVDEAIASTTEASVGLIARLWNSIVTWFLAWF